MIATNHYLAGVAGAVVLNNPLLALPFALASHFVLDVMPHQGLKYSEGRGKKLILIATADTLILLVAISLTVRHYPAWYVLAGIIAISPDVAWIYRFIVAEKFGQLAPQPANKFNKLHQNIQKLESEWGALVELLVMVLLAAVLFYQVF